MAPDAESRIIMAVTEIVSKSEQRVIAQVSDVRTAMATLVERQKGFESQCVLKHELVDKNMNSIRVEASKDLEVVRSDVRRQQDSITDVAESAEQAGRTDQLAMQDEAKKVESAKSYWGRYAVATIIGFLMSGGGKMVIDFFQWRATK